jgi:integration host factor subunit alpha
MNMTLTKAELTDNLSNKLGLSKPEAKQFIDLLFEELRLSLSQGKEVKLSGFGNFAVRDKNSRPGRNPRTGKEVEVTARRVVTFHPGQRLKESIENCHFEINDGA